MATFYDSSIFSISNVKFVLTNKFEEQTILKVSEKINPFIEFLLNSKLESSNTLRAAIIFFSWMRD